jgi:hypothetical protein
LSEYPNPHPEKKAFQPGNACEDIAFRVQFENAKF